MWLDDDGDDVPISGPVPDPSERTWRHPSEIAAELARSNEADETSELPLGRPEIANDVVATPGHDLQYMFRPLPLAGSCLAVAALGVAALFLFGPTPGGEIIAGSNPDFFNGDGLASAKPFASIQPSISSESVASSVAQTTTSGPIAPFGARATGTTKLTTTTKPRHAEHPDNKTSSQPSSTLRPSASALSELPSEGAVVASAPTESAIPGVYVASTDQRLASVVMVATDGFLLTSASALREDAELAFWTGNDWMETQVLALDELSDIAVLTLDASPASLKLPELKLAENPVTIGELVSAGIVPHDVSGNDSAYPSAKATDPGVTKSQLAAAGQVISVGNNEVLVWSGHQVFDLIRADMSFTRALAGGPLLDSGGHTVGLIIGSDHPNTSAIPIETALAYARDLIKTGSIAASSVGIEAVTLLDRGIRIDAVSPIGPYSEVLQPGDVVLTADGHRLLSLDRYHHLLRKSEPGTVIVMSIERDRKVHDLELILEP